MMEFLIIVGALVFAAVLAIPAILRRNKIQKNGVEEDAVISRIEKKRGSPARAVPSYN